MANDLQLIICAFDMVGRADEVKKSLKELDDESPTVKLGDIAIVKKDPDGSISFHETGDHRTVVSKVAGAVAGGVAWFVYAFAGSLGNTAGPLVYDDAYNAAQSRLKDAGFPDYALRELGEHLDAGSSALITLVTADEADLVKSAPAATRWCFHRAHAAGGGRRRTYHARRGLSAAARRAHDLPDPPCDSGRPARDHRDGAGGGPQPVKPALAALPGG